MRRFFIRSGIFTAIVLAIIFLLTGFLNRQMKQLKYEDASVWNEIAKGGIDADILVCGSSRAATHIDPRLIAAHTGESCYNLGMMGHNFYIEDARYAFYLKHNKAPRLIILSLDYESLQKREDLFNHTQFIAYLHDSIIREATKHYTGFSGYDYELPLLPYVGEQTLVFDLFKNYFHPSRNKPDRYHGFYPRNFQWNATVDHILDTLQPVDVHNDSLSIATFEYFLHECNEQDIQLIFVNTPVHVLGQPKVKNRKEIIQFFQLYARRNNIPFYDYTTDAMCLDKKYFMNSTHLNAIGAEFFTRKMIADFDRDSVWRSR